MAPGWAGPKELQVDRWENEDAIIGRPDFREVMGFRENPMSSVWEKSVLSSPPRERSQGMLETEVRPSRSNR